jgi:hypothetical protein
MKRNLILLRTILCLFLIQLLASLADAAACYLDPAATGASDGSSWTNAWTTIAQMTAGSTAGDIIHIQNLNSTLTDVDWPFARTYMATVIRQFGITWTLDAEHQIGQFANHDMWVIPTRPATTVTVSSVDPAWGLVDEKHYGNGAMVNPDSAAIAAVPKAMSSYHGFDERRGSYNATCRQTFPAVLTVNSSLISAESWTVRDANGPKGNPPRPCIKTYAVLTILGAAPTALSFRPPYAGTTKTLHPTADLHRELLLNLSKSGISCIPAIEAVSHYFDRPWIDHFCPTGDSMQYLHSSYDMPPNGDIYMKYVGRALMLLNLEDTAANKEPLLIRLVQLGIDLSEIEAQGGWWPGGGQVNGGRKAPIIFAGFMLDNAYMKAVGERSEHAKSKRFIFQEDYQTFYVGDRPTDILTTPYSLSLVYKAPKYEKGTVTVTHGSTTVAGSGVNWQWYNGHPPAADKDYLQTFGVAGDDKSMDHYGSPYRVASLTDSTHLELTVPYTGVSQSGAAYRLARQVVYGHGQYNTGPYRDLDEYTEAERGLPEWGNEPDTAPYMTGFLHTDFLAPSYRQQNSFVYPGYLLGILFLKGGKAAWKHDALFDYTDRWVKGFAPPYDWATVGKSKIRAMTPFDNDAFQYTMWTTYRHLYPPVWPERSVDVIPPSNSANQAVDVPETAAGQDSDRHCQ